MRYYLVRHKNDNFVLVVECCDMQHLIQKYPRDNYEYYSYPSSALVFYESQKQAEGWAEYLNKGFTLLQKEFM